jgi:F-type H+-transporting ATPase subunit delta
MKNNQAAIFYAQAILELGQEHNVDMAGELTSLQEVINISNDLENLLFLDIFTVEEKISIFNDIAQKLNLNTITKSFISFLIEEKRISDLPLIYKEVMVIDDHNKGFIRGTIEGNLDNIDDSIKTKLESFIKTKINKDAKLEYKKNNNITAGYKVTVEDLQLDASIDSQLNAFKNSVLN